MPFMCQILGVYLDYWNSNATQLWISNVTSFFCIRPEKTLLPIVENMPIRMRVIYTSQRIEFMSYRIDIAKWDADKQRVKNGCTNKLKQSASEINADLLKYYAEIQNVFKEFEVQEAMPTTPTAKGCVQPGWKMPTRRAAGKTQINFGKYLMSL